MATATKPVKNTAPAAGQSAALTPGQKAAATKAAQKKATEEVKKPAAAAPTAAAKKAPLKSVPKAAAPAPAPAAAKTPAKPAAKTPAKAKAAEPEVPAETEATEVVTMGRKELAESLRLALKEYGYGMSEKMALQVVKTYEEVVVAALSQQVEINMPGFGKFATREVPEREARNPQSGEAMTVGAHRKVVFKVGRTLKDAVNGLLAEEVEVEEAAAA